MVLAQQGGGDRGLGQARQRGDREAREVFGQVRVGGLRGRARQRREQAEMADVTDEAQAQQARGAATGRG